MNIYVCLNVFTVKKNDNKNNNNRELNVCPTAGSIVIRLGIAAKTRTFFRRPRRPTVCEPYSCAALLQIIVHLVRRFR